MNFVAPWRTGTPFSQKAPAQDMVNLPIAMEEETLRDFDVCKLK